MTESARLVIAVDSRQVGQAQSALDSLGRASSLVSKAVSAVGPALGVRELYQATEAYSSIANRMRLVTESAVELRAAQEAVFQSAQTARQPLAATAELYQRIAANQKALHLSGKGVAGITDTISKSLAISGASAASANAALIQLGQAFASGTLRGEELNSVMEQAPALSQAIAAGMGVTIGQLRSLGAEGKLTAEAVVKALQNQADAVDEKFGRIANTVGGAMQVAGNSITRLIGEMDQATGTTAAFAGGIIGASTLVDKFTDGSEALSTSLTVVGAAMTIAAGRVAGGYAQQGAAALYAANANRVALNAAAATAKQDLISAQSKRVDAKATLEVMTLNLTAAEAKVASDRVVMASEVSRIKMVQTALASELALEQQRMKSQISEAGRAATVARMVEIRGAQVLINKQVEASERTLAATTVATSAQVQAAYAKVTAAKVGVGETTAVVNAAVVVSDRATAAASTFAGAGKAVLGLLGGPLGLVFTVGAVAASYFMFRDGANEATSALIDQNGTLDDSIQKFRELSAEQQRFQSSKWVEAQESALDSAARSLAEYASRGSQAFNSLGMSGVESAEAFGKMVAEVKAGTRSLDSVTEWVSKNNQIMPSFKSMLEQTAAAYSVSGEKADKFGKLLAQSNGVTTSATTETEKLAAAQAAASKSNGANAGEWDKYIAKLTETRDLLGANAAAEAEYNAAKMGANAQQVAQAKLIAEQTDTLKKYQDAIKEGDKVQQASLKLQLVALYTAEDAATQAAATQIKAYADTATAAESSARRQITAVEQAANFAVASAARVAVGTSAPQSSLSGYGLLTNGGTAPAAPVTPRATPNQRADATIAQLDATTEANKRVDKAANSAATALKNQKKALEDLLASSAISTKSSNDMADAYLAGADNVRELTIQQKIEEELLKTGAGARDAVTAAVNREADAKDRLDITKSIASMRIETTQTLAQATATLQGKTALEAFNIQKSMTVALAGKNIEYGSKEYQLLLDQTKAQLDANKALEQAGQVEGIVDRLNPQIKLLKDFTAEQEALNAAIQRYPENAALYQDALAKLGQEYEVNQSKATIWGQLTEGAIDRIDGVFADAWANIGNGANNLWDSLVKGAKQAFGEIAHMLTTKPLLASISNWLTGTDNGQGLSSVWGKLLGSATGQQGGSGGGMAGMGSNLVSMGKSIYQAYSAITGVGSSVASGYASGGISGALSGGARYYGNMLSSISSTLSNGFTSLASTITGTAAVQTAATIGAQGASSALLSGAVTEGAAAVGAQFTTGVATTTAATYAAAEAGAAATAASLGGQISAAVSSAAAMWPLAVIMGMYQSGKLYDAGVRPDAGEIMDSGGKTALGKVAMAPGAAMSGFFEAQDKALSKVVGGKWAAILSGSTLHQAVTKYVGEKLFGGAWQTKNSGISLGVESGQLEAQQFIDQKKKGGLFSSSKKRTRYSALDAQTAESLSAVYDATEQGVIALVSRIGISANEGTFDGLNIAKSKLSTKGKTGEEVQKLVSDWFSSASDQMVGFLDGGTGGFGYSFAELAQRIASFETFNGTLDTLNIAVLGLSPHGMELANSLIAAAGGMEAFQTATNTYYDNFFSEAEKADDTLSAITKQFAAMGVTLPGTRDAYRGMVEALDMTTASGQSMFMTLTGLAGNAAQAYSILEQRADAAAAATAAAAEAVAAATAAAKELADAQKEALMGSVSSAMSAVQRAISAQQKATTEAYNATTASLNGMVSTATENVSGLTSVGNDLSAALKALRGDSDDAVKMLRAQAQATLQSALATAKAGGSLSGVTGLSDALDTVGSNNTDLYSSLEDFNRDQGRTASVVAELNSINGKQLTTAEKSLKGLETQIDLAKKAYDAQMAAFDSQLAFAQSQLDALNGVDSSVISVSAAISAMNASVVAALSAISGAATGATSTNNETLVESLYNSVLGRKSEAEGKANWVARLQSGAVTYDQLFAGFTGSDEYKQKKAAGVPGFASGGSFGGGLRLVGENGPELEVTGPSRIYNANQTASMLNGGGSNAGLVTEIRALGARLDMIQAETKAGALNGGKIVKLLDRVTDGGNAMLTKELA